MVCESHVIQSDKNWYCHSFWPGRTWLKAEWQISLNILQILNTISKHSSRFLNLIESSACGWAAEYSAIRDNKLLNLRKQYFVSFLCNAPWLVIHQPQRLYWCATETKSHIFFEHTYGSTSRGWSCPWSEITLSLLFDSVWSSQHSLLLVVNGFICEFEGLNATRSRNLWCQNEEINIF